MGASLEIKSKQMMKVLFTTGHQLRNNLNQLKIEARNSTVKIQGTILFGKGNARVLLVLTDPTA